MTPPLALRVGSIQEVLSELEKSRWNYERGASISMVHPTTLPLPLAGTNNPETDAKAAPTDSKNTLRRRPSWAALPGQNKRCHRRSRNALARTCVSYIARACRYAAQH